MAITSVNIHSFIIHQQKSSSGLNLTLRHHPKPVRSASKCSDTLVKKVSFVAPTPVPPKPAHASQLISTEGAEEVPVDLKEFGDFRHFGFVYVTDRVFTQLN